MAGSLVLKLVLTISSGWYLRLIRLGVLARFSAELHYRVAGNNDVEGGDEEACIKCAGSLATVHPRGYSSGW